MDDTTHRGEDLELLSRVLVGLLLMGGDELLQHVREFHAQVEAEYAPMGDDVATDDETAWDLVRHLAIGALLRGERRIADRMYRGVELSLSTAGWMGAHLDKWTDNRLARPIRRPVERRWRRLKQYAGVIADEGRVEEQKSRQLAELTADGLVDEIMGYLSDNPELALLIREQVAAQSAGLAEVVAGSTRQVTVPGDDAVEGLMRRLLRRKPREALPVSPFAGKPQTMYRKVEPRKRSDHDK
jgi:hypothetical protein